MRHLFDRPLGACAPCGFLFKNATFDVGSLISSGLSFAGQMATNQINAERAASDMATYLNMVSKQRKWQKEDQLTSMLNTKALMDYQNAYDSPSAQRKRYEEAGLNPYLAANSGQIGSGNSMSIPNPNLGERVVVSPIQRPALENPVSSAADKLFNASALHSQRIGALSSFSKSLPDLVKSVGKDGAKRIAQSVLGDSGLDLDRIDSLINIQVGRESIAKQREELALQISQEFDRADRDVLLQNLSLEGHRINAAAQELYTQGKLNEQSIQELITRSAKNVAEAAHLNADTRTLDALRPFVTKSAEMQADLDYFDRQEGAALYHQGSKARTWMVSEYGKNDALGQQVEESNQKLGLINRIVRGTEKRQKRVR